MYSLRGKESLQEIAHKLVQEKLKAQAADGPKERTIFVIGSSSAVSLVTIYSFTNNLSPFVGKINDYKSIP